MSKFKTMVAAAGLAAGLAVAGSASANITTFASFVSLSTNDIQYTSNGKTGSAAAGMLTTLDSSGHVGATIVDFSYLQPQLKSISPLLANFTFSGTTNQVDAQGFGQVGQQGFQGNFTFTSVNAFTVGHTTYAAGTNLLSATIFNDADVVGQANASAAGLQASTDAGATISYSSSVLAFAQGSSYDLGLALNAFANNFKLKYVSNKTIGSFTATAGGQFSSDPAPLVNGVPEPSTWALMLVGLGFMGGALRFRARKTAGVFVA